MTSKVLNWARAVMVAIGPCSLATGPADKQDETITLLQVSGETDYAEPPCSALL